MKQTTILVRDKVYAKIKELDIDNVSYFTQALRCLFF